MCCYNHLTIEERESILKLQGHVSIREIARQLGRTASTISREIKRNSEQGKYSANKAQQKYQARRKKCVRKRLLENPSIYDYVTQGLNKQWSPEQISGRLKKETGRQVISYTTIYRGFNQGILPKSLIRQLRKRGLKVIAASKEKRGRIHDYRTIATRPKAANQRRRLGDWECDTVRGALNKGCLATFVDRKSRYLLAVRMPDRKAATMTSAMITTFSRLPKNKRRSFTVDHGNEFFGFRDVEKAINMPVFFADPYSPWQRGTNENTNGLIRQYFPKKFDFLSVSQSDVDAIVSLLNHRPRKVLGFATPFEVFLSSCCT